MEITYTMWYIFLSGSWIWLWSWSIKCPK